MPCATAQDLHHGSSSIQVLCCGVSSSSMLSAALHQQHRRHPVCAAGDRYSISICKRSVRRNLILLLIIFLEIIVLLCHVSSMIELFMLVFIIFIIYLFWNLIIQLPNYSTHGTWSSKLQASHESYFYTIVGIAQWKIKKIHVEIIMCGAMFWWFGGHTCSTIVEEEFYDAQYYCLK